MRRREFITLAGSTAIAWPLAARAQQSMRTLTIGYLSGGTVATQGPWIAAFARRLGELGWIEGREAIIGYQRFRHDFFDSIDQER